MTSVALDGDDGFPQACERCRAALHLGDLLDVQDGLIVHADRDLCDYLLAEGQADDDL